MVQYEERDAYGLLPDLHGDGAAPSEPAAAEQPEHMHRAASEGILQLAARRPLPPAMSLPDILDAELVAELKRARLAYAASQEHKDEMVRHRVAP